MTITNQDGVKKVTLINKSRSLIAHTNKCGHAITPCNLRALNLIPVSNRLQKFKKGRKWMDTIWEFYVGWMRSTLVSDWSLSPCMASTIVDTYFTTILGIACLQALLFVEVVETGPNLVPEGVHFSYSVRSKVVVFGWGRKLPHVTFTSVDTMLAPAWQLAFGKVTTPYVILFVKSQKLEPRSLH